MKDNGYNLRNFIVGIFNSGISEFDATYILGDIRHMQRINKWKPNQVGSFIFWDDFDAIEAIGDRFTNKQVPHSRFKTITEKYSYIFEWLKLFDFNIIVTTYCHDSVVTYKHGCCSLVLSERKYRYFEAV
jgi:lipoprotein-releasing system permease protein